MLGKVIIVEYNLYPGMLGLGIPQRTPNYILGRPVWFHCWLDNVNELAYLFYLN